MAEYLCKENMSTGEYISRDEALKIFHQCCDNCTSSYNGVMCRVCSVATLGAMDILIDIPAADVQPTERVIEVEQLLEECERKLRYLLECEIESSSERHSIAKLLDKIQARYTKDGDTNG